MNFFSLLSISSVNLQIHGFHWIDVKKKISVELVWRSMLGLRILSAIQRSREEFLTKWKIILRVGNVLNINICYDERSLKTWRFIEVLEAHWSVNLSSKVTLLYMLLSFLNVLKWFSHSSDLITCKDKKHRNAQVLIFTFLCAKLM